MNEALHLLAVATVVTASSVAAGSELSASEIAEILQIQAWHVREPAKGNEWSLEVVAEQPKLSGHTLEKGSALVSLRPSGDDQYEFVLKQRGAQSSGAMVLCREPEGSEAICESYSLEFEPRPKCLDNCSRAVLAHLAPMMGSKGQRWLLLVTEPTLTIQEDDKTAATPLP
jgi:hypothetical protein